MFRFKPDWARAQSCYEQAGTKACCHKAALERTYVRIFSFLSLSLKIRVKRKLTVCIVYALDGMMMMIRVCVCLIRSGPVQDISREREGHGCVREGCGGV